ncbi:Nudix family hydrolase [Solilutibacter silvestris]|uniref:8-oxo-dGTP diphosphatase n=1 Tax=Solilutibacter silvestris TaxID=1645665 RepID=A0A2K1Q2T8_9GAMM|nr:Nudix family hydrolase [Lysobacter silvestris]PNS09291.1 mutt: mutT protein [Lysobacter silvestris]
MEPIHVVAGVIRDVRGRILLARRTQGRDLAGLWEFPGGKIEPGETPQQALQRELREELGIEATVGGPLIAVPQHAPKALMLDVYEIKHYRNAPRGLDGQALAWVPPEKLAQYAMPPADGPVVAALLQPDRLLITPEPVDGDAWLRALEASVERHGIRRVQLRAPLFATSHPDDWRRLVEQACASLRGQGVDVWINGDAGLAREFDAGLHLRSTQLSSPAASEWSGLRLAASCHSMAELQVAAGLRCDFALLGPVKETRSHPGVVGIGWNMFRDLRAQVPVLPVYALGGLGSADIVESRRNGAQGIAAISAWNA